MSRVLEERQEQKATKGAMDSRKMMMIVLGAEVLLFGQAPLQALSTDPLGGPVLAGAFTLMQALIKKTEK